VVTPPSGTPSNTPPNSDPVKPEPPKPDPVKPDPIKPDPPKPDPVKPPAPKPEPPKPDPVKPPAKAVAFKEVAPLFRTYCGNCHGMVGKPKGGVDLRTLASIMKGGDDGALIKAGDPDKSPLYESIKAGRMPPDGKPAPTEKELMLIRDWIASGAKERRRTIRRRGDRGNGRHRMELTADGGAG
jgi:outer membrane biosynthesis protein TonB